MIASLLLVPNPFGALNSVTLSSLSILTLLTVFSYILDSSRRPYGFLRVVGGLPACFFLLLAVVQIIPLPPLLVEAISPGTFQLYKPLLSHSSYGSWITFSIVPKATLHSFFIYLSFGCLYVLAVQLFSDRLTVKKSIIYGAIGVALVALWSVSTLAPFSHTGTGEIAQLLYLVVPVSFGLFVYYIPVVSKEKTIMGELRLLIYESGFHRHILYFVICLILVLVLIALYKWEALFQIYLVAVLFLLLYSFKFARTSRPLVVLILLLVVPPVVLYCLWGRVGVEEWRLGKLSAGSSIFILDIVPKIPLLGYGLGTYEQVYPYLIAGGAASDVSSQQPFMYKLLVEVGWIGCCLFTWFFFSVFVSIWKMIKKRADRFVTLLGVGALAGFALVILQGNYFTELKGSGSGVYWALCIGFAVAAVHCRFHYYEAASYLQESTTVFRISMAIMSGLLLFLAIVFHGGAWYASYLLKAMNGNPSDTTIDSVQQRVEGDYLVRAHQLDPLESGYLFGLGELQNRQGNIELAQGFWIASGFKNVMDGRVYQRLARYTDKNDVERGVLLVEAYEREPDDVQHGIGYGQYLFASGRRDDALNFAKKVISIDPSIAKNWLSLLYSNMVTREELAKLLPQSVEVWLQLAHFSDVKDDYGYSHFYYEGALTLIGKSEHIDPQWFLEIYNYYTSNSREDMAVLVIRRAITLLPEVPVFHRLLGDYYMKENVRYRAIEEYEQALLLSPGDKVSQKKLDQLQTVH